LTYFSRYDALRESAPIYRGDAGTGDDFWMVTRFSTIRAVLQRPDLFSSSAVTVTEPDPPYLWIPLMLDPPEHTTWRHQLAPVFSPSAIAKLEPRVRQRCVELIESFASAGHCDFVEDLAHRFPTTIFMELMGLPIADFDRLMAWEHAILRQKAAVEGGSPPLTAMREVTAYFAELVAERRRQPSADLLSEAATWEVDGEPIPERELLAMCLLLFMAGLDTVAAQLSYSMLHLATHAADRRRIIEERAVIPAAVEEFLRAYSIVLTSRKVTEDIELEGCPMKKGQMVYLPLCSGTRDGAEFADAGTVEFDRSPNHHIAFGAGPHRCLGSHLARLELKVALEEWHTRIPSYRVSAGVEIIEHGGVLGLDSLPLEWDT